MRGRQTRQMNFRAGTVGDIDGGREPFQRHRATQKLGGIGGYRRRDLRRDDELPAAQPSLEIACSAALGNHGPAILALGFSPTPNSVTEPGIVGLVLQVLHGHYYLDTVRTPFTL